MSAIPIHDAGDPRIAVYRNVRDRDLAGRDGVFVAEGKVVLNVLFQARRFEAQSVLLLENRLAGMADTLAHAPADLPVYVAPAAVLDSVVGFHLHRGVLAIGVRGAPRSVGEILDPLPHQALVVVMMGISNHDNVGAIFRNAAAFGADAVLLDSECCDPLYRKAIRVSVGAALKVPFAMAPSIEILSALDERRFRAIALTPRGKDDLRELTPSARTAVILGPEGAGLPDDVLAVTRTVRIAMAPGFDSLNVAAASAIALHHLSLRLPTPPSGAT